MTDTGRAQPLVRPWFLKVSVAAFVVLIPFVVNAVWSYVESQRLADTLRALQMKGEPTQTYAPPPSPSAAEADREYRAAAALATSFRAQAQIPLSPLTVAIQKDEWPPEAVGALASSLAGYGETFALVDRAAALPFDVFLPWTSYPLRTSDLLNLQTLSGYRAIYRALSGDADGAVNALYAEAQLARTMGTFSFQRMPRPLILAQVLERTKPSADALGRLAAALGGLDDDHEDTRWFEELRRQAIANGWPRVSLGLHEALYSAATGFSRPWRMHRLNQQLDTFGRLIDASRLPWPSRIDAMMAVDDTPIFQRGRGPGYLESFVPSSASQTAGFRCLRVIVAIETYRRDHGDELPPALDALRPTYLPTIPVDPFSGSDLRMKREEGGYSIYSVGVNRKDDQGADVNLPFVGGVYPKGHPADIGVRVRYR